MPLSRPAFGLCPTALAWPRVRSLQASLRPARFFAVVSAPKRIVFLGTPPVAAQTLNKLAAAAKNPDVSFTLVGVVTQPPAPVGRKRVLTKSPVHLLAEELQVPKVLTPASAKDPAFLEELRTLAPDLCVTAAYGNFLPKAFLDIPEHGTLNIHPSLLPAFRGAAPVPRALEKGVKETGVCVLYTVLKMDAGPVLTQRRRVLKGHEQAPSLLEELFATGTDALLEVLPKVWNGSIEMMEQEHELATHAPKISKEEARLSFTENAQIVHNRVRAFAGWPGTWGDFLIKGDKGVEDVRLKIVESTVIRPMGGMCLGVHDVTFDDEIGCIAITCDDGSRLGALTVQPPGKKAMDARSFWNGLRGKNVERKRVPH